MNAFAVRWRVSIPCNGPCTVPRPCTVPLDSLAGAGPRGQKKPDMCSGHYLIPSKIRCRLCCVLLGIKCDSPRHCRVLPSCTTGERNGPAGSGGHGRYMPSTYVAGWINIHPASRRHRRPSPASTRIGGHRASGSRKASPTRHASPRHEKRAPATVEHRSAGLVPASAAPLRFLRRGSRHSAAGRTPRRSCTPGPSHGRPRPARRPRRDGGRRLRGRRHDARGRPGRRGHGHQAQLCVGGAPLRRPNCPCLSSPLSHPPPPPPSPSIHVQRAAQPST